MSRWTAIGCGAAAGILCLASAPVASAGMTMSGPELASRLRNGERLLLRNVTVHGQFNLRTVGIVRTPFTCHACIFTGSFDAPDVLFTNKLDLSGSTFKGDVNANGAVFDAPAAFGLFRGAPTRFLGHAAFSLASFGALAQFEGANFDRGTDFSLVRFGSEAAFASAIVNGPAIFASTTFAGTAHFANAQLNKEATFVLAAFLGDADFRQAAFGSTVDFERTSFASVADFSNGSFTGEADFRRARFADDAIFRGGEFLANFEDSVTLDGATTRGTLDFSSAHFVAPVLVTGISAPKVTFANALFEPRATLALEGASSPDFYLPLALLHTVPERANQKLALALDEQGAKARGDLTLANDAHYKTQVLASRSEPWWRHGLDWVLYRQALGYLVRPRPPVQVLIVLALAFSLMRALQPKEGRDKPADNGLGQRTVTWGGSYVAELFDTLARIFQRQGPTEESRLRRAENAGYRVLLAAAIVALAASNPNLRQMVDALK